MQDGFQAIVGEFVPALRQKMAIGSERRRGEDVPEGIEGVFQLQFGVFDRGAHLPKQQGCLLRYSHHFRVNRCEPVVAAPGKLHTFHSRA